jgi:hypothetical protein
MGFNLRKDIFNSPKNRVFKIGFAIIAQTLNNNTILLYGKTKRPRFPMGRGLFVRASYSFVML